MTALHVDVGDVVLLDAEFVVGSSLTDPTLATVIVKDPSGVTSTPSVAHSGTGTFSAEVTVDMAGTWRVRWEGTGAAAGAEETAFIARWSDF